MKKNSNLADVGSHKEYDKITDDGFAWHGFSKKKSLEEKEVALGMSNKPNIFQMISDLSSSFFSRSYGSNQNVSRKPNDCDIAVFFDVCLHPLIARIHEDSFQYKNLPLNFNYTDKMLFTGAPGCGKTTRMLQVVDKLIDEGAPFLYIETVHHSDTERLLISKGVEPLDVDLALTDNMIVGSNYLMADEKIMSFNDIIKIIEIAKKECIYLLVDEIHNFGDVHDEVAAIVRNSEAGCSVSLQSPEKIDTFPLVFNKLYYGRTNLLSKMNGELMEVATGLRSGDFLRFDADLLTSKF